MGWRQLADPRPGAVSISLMPSRPRAIVTGMVVTYPVGGVAWDYLQYAMALESLGYEVHYLEDTGWKTYDRQTARYGTDPACGLEFLAQTLAAIQPTMADRWCFRDMDGRLHGPDAARMPDLIATSDLLLNVSGGTLLRPEYAACPRKVLIDTDPGLNHFVNFPKWDAKPGWHGSLGWRAHDAFFTYASRIGQTDCVLPLFGIDWHATRPPVQIDHWRAQPPAADWTTIMSWKNFEEPIVHNGVSYGAKEREFIHIEDLPKQVSAKLEVACGGEPPLDRWRERGWQLADAPTTSATAASYQHYIQQSRGEFSVAKNIYVATGSGWFSCRSVCYLAAGRPVVVQDTGFSRGLPCGEGLLAFTSPDEAVDQLRRVEADYPRHARAARRLAGDYFDGRIVVKEILNQVGLP